MSLLRLIPDLEAPVFLWGRCCWSYFTQSERERSSFGPLLKNKMRACWHQVHKERLHALQTSGWGNRWIQIWSDGQIRKLWGLLATPSRGYLDRQLIFVLTYRFVKAPRSILNWYCPWRSRHLIPKFSDLAIRSYLNSPNGTECSDFHQSQHSQQVPSSV
jgi:hypothetical protein